MGTARGLEYFQRLQRTLMLGVQSLKEHCREFATAEEVTRMRMKRTHAGNGVEGERKQELNPVWVPPSKSKLNVKYNPRSCAAVAR